MHRGLWTRPYRYGYALSTEESMGEMAYDGASGFLKYDLQTGSDQAHRLQAHYSPNEPFFVSAGSGEDDGYLLSFIYDRRSHSSALWILDAGSLAAPPVAKIKLPVRVPQGFHGVWVGEEDLV